MTRPAFFGDVTLEGRALRVGLVADNTLIALILRFRWDAARFPLSLCVLCVVLVSVTCQKGH
eukprot:3773063-Pleurochrysis_carterae.AAC.1